MKASELRIGNLVQSINDTPSHGLEIMEITSISSNGTGHYNGIENLGKRTDDMEEMGWFSADCNLLGIPLTKEWLVKFQFIKTGTSRYGHKYTIGVADWGFTIENSFNAGKWFFGHEYYDSPNEDENNKSLHFCYDLKYVHQLQNIYFALTGNELELQHT